MGQQRRQFSPEFKRDAVALVRSSGRPIAQIAKELGIGESNLRYWLAKDRETRVTADPERFAAEVAESGEVKRLRRKVAELEVEREILKHSMCGTGGGAQWIGRIEPPVSTAGKAATKRARGRAGRRGERGWFLDDRVGPRSLRDHCWSENGSGRVGVKRRSHLDCRGRRSVGLLP